MDEELIGGARNMSTALSVTCGPSQIDAVMRLQQQQGLCAQHRARCFQPAGAGCWPAMLLCCCLGPNPKP